MWIAPSFPAARAGFDPLPIYIGLFCVFWSFGFIAGGLALLPFALMLSAKPASTFRCICNKVPTR